jgi:hypothetical protein
MDLRNFVNNDTNCDIYEKHRVIWTNFGLEILYCIGEDGDEDEIILYDHRIPEENILCYRLAHAKEAIDYQLEKLKERIKIKVI